MNRYYNDFSTWIKTVLPYKVQKISIDAGFSCPNRDGRISYGGCVFCDNKTFNPSYCNPKKSISQQILEGKDFFKSKYPDMKYLAYFQAFTNTYAPIAELKRMYREALEVEEPANATDEELAVSPMILCTAFTALTDLNAGFGSAMNCEATGLAF